MSLDSRFTHLNRRNVIIEVVDLPWEVDKLEDDAIVTNGKIRLVEHEDDEPTAADVDEDELIWNDPALAGFAATFEPKPKSA